MISELAETGKTLSKVYFIGLLFIFNFLCFVTYLLTCNLTMVPQKEERTSPTFEVILEMRYFIILLTPQKGNPVYIKLFLNHIQIYLQNNLTVEAPILTYSMVQDII
jgi:hypothetical protein